MAPQKYTECFIISQFLDPCNILSWLAMR